MKAEFFISLLYFSIFYLALFLGDISLSSFQRIVSSDSLAKLEWNRPYLRASIFPLIGLFLILSLGMGNLFHWTALPEMKFRSLYLSPLPFYLRNGIYFALWAFLIQWRWIRRPLPAPLVFILMVFSMTFASIDWIQSLDSDFHSTAFGLIFFLSCGLLTLAFRLSQVPENCSESVLIKLNNLHLAFIGSWTYVVFMQFLVIWSGNIPNESAWYVHRLDTNWEILAILVTIFQFVIPIPLLLFRSLKQSVSFTRTLAHVTIASQALYLFWLILPSFEPDGFRVSVFPLVSLFAAFLLVFYFSRRRLNATA